MEKEDALTFNIKELFNSTRLKQYDEEGQKGFLGYLIKNEKIEIRDNNIVFPNITSEDKVEENIKAYNTETMKYILKNKLQAINVASVKENEVYRKELTKQLDMLCNIENNKHTKDKRKNRYR